MRKPHVTLTDLRITRRIKVYEVKNHRDFETNEPAALNFMKKNPHKWLIMVKK